MIRKAEEKDTKEIWQTHVASIRGVCDKDYRPDQIEFWSAFEYSHDHWAKTMKCDYVLVVEKDGRVEGFCHVAFPDEETCEIVGLFLSPKVIGKGYGGKLVAAAIEYIKCRSPRKIFLNSTKTAKGFYERMGFFVSGPEVLHETRGTRIECLPMKMELL